MTQRIDTALLAQAKHLHPIPTEFERETLRVRRAARRARLQDFVRRIRAAMTRARKAPHIVSATEKRSG